MLKNFKEVKITVELLQLRYFKKLAETGNVTKTAKQLYISPPSLSAMITRLERELGVTLFDRTGNKITLNQCGQVFYDSITNMLSELDNAVLRVTDMYTEDVAHLSVAMTSNLIWRGLLQAFNLNFPMIAISQTDIRLNQFEIKDVLNQYDFLITAPEDITIDDVFSEILYSGDYPVLAVYPTHPLANRHKIALHEVMDEPFITLSESYSARKYFDEVFKAAGFKPKIIMEGDYILRTQMLNAKSGIVLTTHHAALADNLMNAVYIEITEPKCPRSQAIFWSKSRYQSNAAKIFLEFALNYYRPNVPGNK